MTDPSALPEDDPRHHTGRIAQMLRDVAAHCREDVGKVDAPPAEALFETTAEVLLGLVNACEDYESRDEPAWRG